MHRIRILCFLALILSPVPGLIPAAPPEAVGANRPMDSLTLLTPSDRAILGETVELTVRLSRRTGKPSEVNALRLARNSLFFEVTIGEETHRITRIYGDLVRDSSDQWVVRDKSPPRANLKRGKPLEFRFPFHVIETGHLSVRALYRGFGAAGPMELASEPVTIEVTPPPGHRELTARFLTSEGALTLSLMPDRAFNTVFNFVTLVRDGRYDGLTFHRILRNFLVQGGDPKGNGLGGPGWTIPGEFDPELKHVKGTVSMARAAPPDSAGSQFFITLGTALSLDGKYAVFGRVVEGLPVLDRIAEVALKPTPDGRDSVPVEPPVIRKVSVGTR